MSKHLEEIALSCLNRLESAEAELLGWGLLDGSFSKDEVEAHVGAELDAVEDPSTCPSTDDVVSWLLERKLLWQIPISPTGPRFRSRMAEGVRLLARLKQMFKEEHWETGLELVADFRLHVANRLFPKRHISIQEVIAALKDADGVSDGDLELAEQFLGPSGFELADFQVRAVKAVLAGVRGGKAGASIVCAGTGSGKTLAFYLPAILLLGSLPKPTSHCHVVAIYPRTELLKDQIRATLESLRDFQKNVSAQRKHPISIGALYEEVPHEGALLKTSKWYDWSKVTIRGAPAYLCPFIVCPSCGADMGWPEADIVAKTSRLECEKCDEVLGPEVVRLSRSDLASNPPDILFTTTEMLNRQLSSSKMAALFGVGVPGAPRLVLLDEAHTYGGVSGAHVGLLLRRWRTLSRSTPYFVGLSATLADASRFMSDLTGVWEPSVRVIEPHPDEMEVGGLEYLIALRGDSVGGASLLSTTIQAAMLVGRLLDTDGVGVSDRVVGNRLFTFTDNLDVTNRLYNDLRDAEGYRLWGPKTDALGSLANLRDPGASPIGPRWEAGQAWTLSTEIGHTVKAGTRRVVGRTSSQDAGVSRDALTIVATASLEVGFDDPDVGAVIQHKAPRDAAQFLQRKGRAGRGRTMRPWTVIVLSDFGRDRLAYQAFDRLFSPEIPPRFLPMRNRYVQRIQATFAFIDWVFHQVRGHGGDAWQLFSGPTTYRPLAHAQDKYADFLQDLLTSETAQGRLKAFLQKALEIDQSEADALLWNPPRSLLLEVAPTLLRRLRTSWSSTAGGLEAHRPNQPVPEFVPQALFDDLNLPEVGISFPNGTEASVEWMSYRQGMTEFAPGRVSHRFAVRNRSGHWCAPPDDEDETLSISTFLEDADYKPLGEFSYGAESGRVHVPVVRPFRVQVQVPPSNISSSSNSFWEWRTQIIAPTDGRRFEPPQATKWARVMSDLAFFTHLYGEPVEVRRFADGFRAEVALRRSEKTTRRVALVDESGHPVAIGFEFDVDAIRIRVDTPTNWKGVLESHPELVRGLRAQRFRQLIQGDAGLDGIANRFQRDSIVDVYLLALIRRAMVKGEELADASALVLGEGAFDEALAASYQLSELLERERDEDEDEEGDGASGLPKRAAKVAALLTDANVLSTLTSHAPSLWEVPDEKWEDGLSARFLETMGSVLLRACERIGSDLTAGDLLVDVVRATNSAHEPQGDPAQGEIWISEANPGGSGFVEAILNKLNEDPQTFYALLDAEAGLTSFEVSDQAIDAFLAWAAPDSPDVLTNIQKAATGIRHASSYRESRRHLEDLRRELSSQGIVPDHGSINAITLRMIRPGTSSDSDNLAFSVLACWKDLEATLGFEVDARMMSCVLSLGDKYDGDLEAIWKRNGEDWARWRFGKFSSLLWPRGADARTEGWGYYNPFAPSPKCDRILLGPLVTFDSKTISAESPSWRDEFDEEIVSCGFVTLVVSQTGLAALKAAVIDLAARPVDTGTVLLHPRIGGVERTTGGFHLHVELPEYFS